MNLQTLPTADNGPNAVLHRRPGRRTANGLIGDPLFHRHSPLTLLWSPEQLTTIADKLRPLLTGEPTARMVLAAAAVARSIVLEEKVTGLGVYYARGKDVYSVPERYRAGDAFFSWYYVTGAMDLLASAGLIDHHLGAWKYGRRSVAYALGELMTLVGPEVDVSHGRALEDRTEAVVLREDSSNKLLDYRDTAETQSMRRDVWQINEALAELPVWHHGRRLHIPIGRRIFNGSFDRGGRLYFQGTSIQNMSAEDRLDLEIVVDGVRQPVVEIDYRALHISMAYASTGEPMPPGDPYHITGFDRAAVKLAANVLFNAKSRRSAVGAVAKEVEGPVSVLLAENPAASGDSIRDLAESLVSAVEHKHRRIRPLFSSDCGARFQRCDSDMAREVMRRMLEQTGRCPLPVHDSFLVAIGDRDLLRKTMKSVAREHGLTLELTERRAVRTAIEDLIRSGSPLVSSLPGEEDLRSASLRQCGSNLPPLLPLAGNSSDLPKQEHRDLHSVAGIADPRVKAASSYSPAQVSPTLRTLEAPKLPPEDHAVGAENAHPP